jgi:FkbM family methyltransferase
MRTLRFRASGYVKQQVMRFYGLPFSRFGLESALVPFLPTGRPITLIDAGAAVGHFAAAVRNHCGIRRALLVEPQPENVRALAALYTGPRYLISECALSDAEGAAELAILNSPASSSLFAVKPEFTATTGHADLRVRNRISVQVRTLDALLAQHGWVEPIDLLKLDVQGAEVKVLRGARQSLARTRLVWAEVSFRPIYDGSAVFAEVYDLMNSEGFRLMALHDGYRAADGELLQADALFCARKELTR